MDVRFVVEVETSGICFHDLVLVLVGCRIGIYDGNIMMAAFGPGMMCQGMCSHIWFVFVHVDS